MGSGQMRQGSNFGGGQIVASDYGMSPEIIERVFEPFFTTKPERQGSGLGLSMVYGFVKQSGGHANIHSEPARGTTVRLYLPRSREREEEDEEPSGVAETGPVVAGTETVLVVEDDDAVRRTVVEMLADLGYREALRQNHELLPGLNVIDGVVTYDGVAQAFGLDYTPVEQALA